ncbi:MAG: hypothetical protein AAF547_06430 [Actinomycetota bacterium]
MELRDVEWSDPEAVEAVRAEVEEMEPGGWALRREDVLRLMGELVERA